VELRVGSKEFAEQLILGQIAVAALGAAGAKVTDRTGLTGTEGAREALTSGEIDLYWEYTGTGWITILGNDEPLAGPSEQFEAAKRPTAGNNLTVLEDDQSFFPAYNVAMTMRAEVYDDHAEAYDALWGSIIPLLTTDTLTELNARLAVDGEPATDIAREFLVENGIIGG